MFNKLTFKVRFHIAVWSLRKSIRASSFIENFPQISAKPIAFQRNLLGKLPRNQPFFTNHFSAKLASKIPAKFPRNWPFFPRICPWKSREIWLFFPRPTRSPALFMSPHLCRYQPKIYIWAFSLTKPLFLVCSLGFIFQKTCKSMAMAFPSSGLRFTL